MHYPRSHNLTHTQHVLGTIPKGSTCPYGRNRAEASARLLPILEILFDMPAPGPRRGSPAWIQALVDRPHFITFEQMMNYPTLLRTYVKSVKNQCNDKGELKLRGAELIPIAQYPTSKKEKGYLSPSQVLKRRRSMGFHPNFQFLRAGAVQWAIEKLRDLGIVPVKIDPETLPPYLRKTGYNNFIKVP